MTITVFATDMDGTFLNSQNDYDRQQFKVLFDQLTKEGKKIVAISGNQYYQIKSFFEDYANQMTIVSENGAYIVENGKLLKSSPLDANIVHTVIDYLEDMDLSLQAIVCGQTSAYILEQAQKADKEMFSCYYTKLLELSSFRNLPNDAILKFSFNTSVDETQAIVDALNHKLGKSVRAVETGNGNVDIISKDVNKGTAMAYLLDKWKLDSNQMLVFGDSNNDLEMLELTDNSYAMLNANEEVKRVANFVTSSNDDNGVLKVIEKFIE